MNRVTQKAFLLGVGIAVIISASTAFGQTVSMQLIGPPPGPSLGGVYISPYTALIGAAGQTVPTISGTATSVICDDFTTDVSTGTPPWQAIATNVASINGESSPDTNLKFDQGSAAQQQTDYTVAAYLATEILQAQQASDLTDQGLLSYALWALFDPGTTTNDPFGGNFITGSTSDPSSQIGMAYQDLQNARSATAGLNPSDFSNVTVYTPTPVQGVSQEYIVVSMPEPSSPALLALDLVGVMGFAFLFRRRNRRTKLN
jgi:hypothetical protein